MDTQKIVKPLLSLLAITAILLAIKFLPFQEWLQPVFDSIDEAGNWGPLLFVGLSFLLVLLFVPVSVLVTSAGLLFGFWLGFALISVTLVLGIIAGFVGGTLLWPKIKDFEMFQRPVFNAVRDAVEKEGNYLIALLRMTPFFHFMTGNLFFGSLNLKGIPYLLFSYLGMIPGTLLLVYAGSVAGSTLGNEEGISMAQSIFLGLGLIIFSGISYRVTKVTRQTLD